ncbi:adenylosuccinate lyase [Mailhella massiliensis]|uniref:Adenylosuccinate lyase n=1 Tax=Mailhella massiliensis TaxID=1903261 RepID=A0A921AXM5_9BACT|nr:adenylosuccinate lyase [Mailhella massiliensis]HJD98232.1 adenylosuccinate lyase [Mailhella massiliensis]
MIERYSRPEMARLWTLENRYRYWFKVEQAVCRAWNEQGVIPDEDLKNILQDVDFDEDKILEIEAVTRHDVIAFLTYLEQKIGPSARFIHLGCTSSDMVDTAMALQMVEAGRMILDDFDLVLDTLKTFIRAHQGLVCMGRSHGIHGEPVTYGFKFAGFYAEFLRDKKRFADAVEDIRTGKLSGAMGTYTVITPAVEARACEILGLKADIISTQIVQRDRYAHYFTSLAIAAGTVERICVELRHLQRTEVHEVEEGFAKGQKGSSAMPHKRNPISAENMCGLARVIRSNAFAALENQALWHERDISHSSVERIITPDSTILMDYVLHRLDRLLKGLRILPENVERNLWGSYGLFFSQRVLTALIEKDMPRQQAYVVVQKRAMESWETHKPFPELIRADEEIKAHLSPAELDAIFDINHYTRYEAEIVDRVLAEQ